MAIFAAAAVTVTVLLLLLCCYCYCCFYCYCYTTTATSAAVTVTATASSATVTAAATAAATSDTSAAAAVATATVTATSTGATTVTTAATAAVDTATATAAVANAPATGIATTAAVVTATTATSAAFNDDDNDHISGLFRRAKSKIHFRSKACSHISKERRDMAIYRSPCFSSLFMFLFFFLSFLGLLPKTLNEWKLLLELLLSRDHQDDKSTHLCAPLASSDWSADLTWSNVTKLMLERLGAGHTVNLLQALALDTPHLSGDFYYSCLLGAVIERRQRYKRPEIIILF